jgi:hypothetical protein
VLYLLWNNHWSNARGRALLHRVHYNSASRTRTNLVSLLRISHVSSEGTCRRYADLGGTERYELAFLSSNIPDSRVLIMSEASAVSGDDGSDTDEVDQIRGTPAPCPISRLDRPVYKRKESDWKTESGSAPKRAKHEQSRNIGDNSGKGNRSTGAFTPASHLMCF